MLSGAGELCCRATVASAPKTRSPRRSLVAAHSQPVCEARVRCGAAQPPTLAVAAEPTTPPTLLAAGHVRPALPCAVSRPLLLTCHATWGHARRAKHHPDLIMCRKLPGIAIGRLCEKCACSAAAAVTVTLRARSPTGALAGDGKCVICDSYVRPATLVRVCDECNYGSYAGRCVICGGMGISDAYYCKECTMQEKDVRVVAPLRRCWWAPRSPLSCVCPPAERRVPQDREPRQRQDGLVLRAQEMCVCDAAPRTRACALCLPSPLLVPDPRLALLHSRIQKKMTPPTLWTSRRRHGDAAAICVVVALPNSSLLIPARSLEQRGPRPPRQTNRSHT